jgi:adenylate cyclase
MIMSRDQAQDSLRTYWIRRPIRGHLLALAVALGLTSLISLTAPQAFNALDERAAGVVWRGSDPERLERRFVLVDIDERSLKEVGPWPWSREKMAELIRALDQQQVGLKLFDVVFPESKGGDQALVGAMGSKGAGPGVAAQIFSLDPSNTTQSGMLSGALPLGVCPPASAKGYGFLANGMNLGKAGHITPRIDPDGAVRQVPALVCFEGKAYPSLVIAGLAEVAGGDSKIELKPADSWVSAAWTAWRTCPAK